MNPTPPPIPDSFEDFVLRFQTLQKEADSFGVASVSVLLDDDMLKRAEDKIVIWTRGYMRTVGMLEYGKHMMLTRKAEAL